ncbi:bifunctional pyr operon transcriptional regulator/uracil phosphoribosyltransferase PyrR [Candidatus Sumerlaeota bacterium]|nr:bifunctional pyr operon transcriptional regulator/uracil phosphoribosyltransferase PyrR [Candidatus Sumerlaeota bacterium]
MTNNKSSLLLDEKGLKKTLKNLADAIADDLFGDEDFVLIGIRTRGVVLAECLQQLIKERTKKKIPIGVLDITLYRDDLSTLAENPIVRASTLPFDVNDKKIVLVDDVIYTGRTIRAALDQIVDFGRPALVKLAVLIDRGLREFPIQPDFVGLKIETSPKQIVQVRLSDIDGDDKVILMELNHKSGR